MARESTGDDLSLQPDAPNMHPRSGARVRGEFPGVCVLALRSLGYVRAFAASRPDGPFVQAGLAHMRVAAPSRRPAKLASRNGAVGRSASP
jgi:hypothetical protein